MAIYKIGHGKFGHGINVQGKNGHGINGYGINSGAESGQNSGSSSKLLEKADFFKIYSLDLKIANNGRGQVI